LRLSPLEEDVPGPLSEQTWISFIQG
jgi:hypothetical protein